jgi:hypothetical protein
VYNETVKAAGRLSRVGLVLEFGPKNCEFPFMADTVEKLDH